jgi:hypothetical protein
MDIVYGQTHTGVLEPAAMLDAFNVPFAATSAVAPKRDRLMEKQRLPHAFLAKHRVAVAVAMSLTGKAFCLLVR